MKHQAFDTILFDGLTAGEISARRNDITERTQSAWVKAHSLNVSDRAAFWAEPEQAALVKASRDLKRTEDKLRAFRRTEYNSHEAYKARQECRVQSAHRRLAERIANMRRHDPHCNVADDYCRRCLGDGLVEEQYDHGKYVTCDCPQCHGTGLKTVIFKNAEATHGRQDGEGNAAFPNLGDVIGGISLFGILFVSMFIGHGFGSDMFHDLKFLTVDQMVQADRRANIANLRDGFRRDLDRCIKNYLQARARLTDAEDSFAALPAIAAKRHARAEAKRYRAFIAQANEALK